jgi:hypothetical protein
LVSRLLEGLLLDFVEVFELVLEVFDAGFHFFDLLCCFFHSLVVLLGLMVEVFENLIVQVVILAQVPLTVMTVIL